MRLLLAQFGDEFPIHVPSQTFRLGRSRQAPSLDGLYDKMTPDDIRRRLAIIESLGVVLTQKESAFG